MLLRCTNNTGIDPIIEPGKDYEVFERWPGYYEVDNIPVKLSNFETPLERFKRVSVNSVKKIIPSKRQGETVELLQTSTKLVFYSHTRGNHWNIGGNHWYYSHDVNTGEYINDMPGEKPLLRQKLLKAELEELQRAGSY